MIFDTWQQIIIWCVLGVIAQVGSPLTQAIRVALSQNLGIEIAGRMAVGLTVLISLGLAAFEMYMSGVLQVPTPMTFPAWFTAIFSVSTIYYKLLS